MGLIKLGGIPPFGMEGVANTFIYIYRVYSSSLVPNLVASVGQTVSAYVGSAKNSDCLVPASWDGDVDNP